MFEESFDQIQNFEVIFYDLKDHQKEIKVVLDSIEDLINELNQKFSQSKMNKLST